MNELRGDPPPSRRELQVVAQLARGKRYREAGAALGIAPATVRHHVVRLCAHFDVHSLTGVLYALGWVKIPDEAAA